MIVLLTDKNISQILDFFKKFKIRHNDIVELYDLDSNKNYVPFPLFNLFKKDIEQNNIKNFKFYKQCQFDSVLSQSIVKIIKIKSNSNLQEFKEFYYTHPYIVGNYKLFYISLIINYIFDKNNSYEEEILCKYLAEELFFNVDSHPQMHEILNTVLYRYEKEQKENSLKNYNEYHTKIKHLLKFLVTEKNKLILSDIAVYPKTVKNVNIICKRSDVGKNLLRFIIKSLDCGINIIFSSSEEKDEIQYFCSLGISKNHVLTNNLLSDFPIEHICNYKFNELLHKQYDYIKNMVNLTYNVNREFINSYKNLMNLKNIKIYNNAYKIYENILDYKNKDDLIYIKSLSFSEEPMNFNRLKDGISDNER